MWTIPFFLLFPLRQNHSHSLLLASYVWMWQYGNWANDVQHTAATCATEATVWLQVAMNLNGLFSSETFNKEHACEKSSKLIRV